MTSPSSSILLRNETVLYHEGQKVRSLKAHDLLIEGDTISRIGLSLVPLPGCKEIDCTAKIVSPGFINAHHHLWQSQLKGRHGNLQSYNYRPEDVFWGQLAGCLQSIYSGVTTVVDHAHMAYSPQHATEGIRASVSSGIRTAFCYTPMRRIRQWSTVEFEKDLLPEWWLQTLDSLAASAPFGNGRVTLGLAADPGIPSDILVKLWQKAHDLGLQLLTMHYVPAFMPNPVPDLSQNSHLLPKALISHGNGISQADAEILTEHRVFIYSTPEPKMQMGLGNPMRLVLQHTHALRNDEAVRKDQYPGIDLTMEQAFNLGTIQGATAIKMQDRIGSLAVGKKADDLIFDASSPSMLCAAEESALGVTMLHSSVRDVETVIVDGKVLKERGVLKPVGNQESLDRDETTTLWGWSDIYRKLLQSRERVLERAAGQDLGAGIAALQEGSSQE